jgi:hypothetical protein
MPITWHNAIGSGAHEVGVTIDDEAMRKTRRRRESYLALGAALAVIGGVLAVYGAWSLSCGRFLSFGGPSCTPPVTGFFSGTIGGLLLGFGVMLLVVGAAMGRYVFVTR